MDVYYALSQPIRRSILENLAQAGKLTAGEICEKFEISAAAISQHLKVLKEAKLVLMEKRAQQRVYGLNTTTVHEVETWAKKMADSYEQRFTALDAVLESEKRKQSGSGSANHSPAN